MQGYRRGRKHLWQKPGCLRVRTLARLTTGTDTDTGTGTGTDTGTDTGTGTVTDHGHGHGHGHGPRARFKMHPHGWPLPDTNGVSLVNQRSQVPSSPAVLFSGALHAAWHLYCDTRRQLIDSGRFA